MSRWSKSLLSAVSQRVISQRCMSHRTRDMTISSPTLDQLEQRCEIIPPIPPPRIQKVTVIGAASDIGLITCLFLKQHSIIRYLAMYDESPRFVVGHCHDLSHLDTSTAVEAYQSRLALQAALRNADVVLLCGGCYPKPPCCNVPDSQLFYSNVRYVHTMTNYVAKNCPKAILCLQVPPVDPLFNVCRHTLKHFKTYDKSRLLGLNSITAMRANQLLCDLAGTDPAGSFCPCVGGTCYCTRVPVFSIMRDFAKANLKGDALAELPRFVREADQLVCRVKCNAEQAHLSTGFATARAIISIMNGLFGGGGSLDSALVEQADPAACYGMKICASPVSISSRGISSYQIPKLNGSEMGLLNESKVQLKEFLEMGKCYALGDDYVYPQCRPMWENYYVDCPEITQPVKKSAKN